MTDDVITYFGTNRAVANDGSFFGPVFGTDITYGEVGWEHLDIHNRYAGTPYSMEQVSVGGFSQAVRDQMVSYKQPICITIHGFADNWILGTNLAPFLRRWLDVPMVMCPFSWPSQGTILTSPADILRPGKAYNADRKSAFLSGLNFAQFIEHVSGVAAQADTELFLIAHSLGSYVLETATALLGVRRLPRPFAEVVLAAPDIDRNAFDPGRELASLADNANRVSVYYSHTDLALDASHLANGTVPMGLSGPADQDNTVRFPPDKFRFVDCSDVHDSGTVDDTPSLLVTHELYVRSPTVRDDIRKVLSDEPVAPGVSKLKAWP